MSNNLQVFRHSTFGELEAILIDGKPYFPATKCAELLGYSNPKDAIIRHCRWVVKHDLPHPQSPSKEIEMNFIPEGDVIRLITHSKLPAAIEFESWIMDTVIPSIIHHGAYATDMLLNNPNLFFEVVKQLKEERDRRIQGDKERALIEIEMDTSKEWFSIKRWAKEHKQSWRDVADPTGRGQGWRRLKQLSEELGYDVKKCFDANYGNVNSYHKNVFAEI